MPALPASAAAPAAFGPPGFEKGGPVPPFFASGGDWAESPGVCQNACMKPLLPPFALACLVVTGVPAWAQSSPGRPVYRCPGPPVLYTDALTPAEARARDCRPIEGVPVTVIQGRPRPPAAANGASAPGGAAPARAAGSRVEPDAQRSRDAEARRILEGELRREEERLETLRKEYNNGEPERRGDERNYQRYLDRVAQLKASIQRAEADTAAIRRELAKMPAP